MAEKNTFPTSSNFYLQHMRIQRELSCRSGKIDWFWKRHRHCWRSRACTRFIRLKQFRLRSTSKIGLEIGCRHTSCISGGSLTYDIWGYLGVLLMCMCSMRREGSWTRSWRNGYWSTTHMNRRGTSATTLEQKKSEWAEMSNLMNLQFPRPKPTRRFTCKEKGKKKMPEYGTDKDDSV